MVVPLGCWSKFGSPSENYDYVYGWNKNAGSRKVVEEFGAFYAGVCNGLDEVDSPADAAKRWLFKGTARGVFTPRAVEDFAMNEFVDGVMSSKVPKTIFDQWIDCNLETGFGSQLRRFAKSFYETPELIFKTLPPDAVKGAFAQTADYADGSLCLRLINNTPYQSEGFLKFSAKSARDMTYERDLETSQLGVGKRVVALKPFDIKVIKISGLTGNIEGQFSFDAKTEKEIIAEAQFILKQNVLLKKVPGDKVALLFDGAARGDAFSLWNVMDDFEVLANVRSAKAMLKSMENQKALLEDISQKGAGRINCGASGVYVDKKGNRWLPDQEFKGLEAYGNIGGNVVNRGDIEIKDEVAPDVYKTEIYAGKLKYEIPLPPGKYNVKFHFAETFIGHSKPGMRLFSVSVAGRMIDDRVDILGKAGALNTPYILAVREVSPSIDGIIDIEMLGNACLNGIEVERCK